MPEEPAIELDCQMWEAALMHLEEMEPKKLERLLKRGALEKHLDNAVMKSLRERMRQLQRNPEISEEVLEHLSRLAGAVPEVNPDKDPGELSPEGEKMLEEFRTMIFHKYEE